MSQKQKRTIFLSLTLLILFSIGGRAQHVFHVSPKAVKDGRGTLESPFNSIQSAQKAVAKKNSRMSEDIVVYLHGGTYNLSAPLVFKENDSGMNGFHVIYKAYGNETPVISGGIRVSGWEKVKGDIYKAHLDRDSKLRTLFVNGKRMRMAGTDIPVAGQGDWGTFNVTGEESWAFGPGTAIDGIKFKAKDVGLYEHPEDIELVQFNVWTEKILCAREMERIGDTTVVKLQQPYGAIATSMAWAGKINYEKNFVVRNAYELLDSPGEFYFNRQTKTIYYYSDGEDMSVAEVVAPVTDGLMQIKGSSVESRVKNIRFEGITFSHDHWQLMEVAGSHGFAGIQCLGLAVKYIPDGNWHPSEYNSTDIPRGSIQVQNAEHITFERNQFKGLSSATAINFVNDVQNSVVEGNYFNDLLGNSVNIGHSQHYKIGDGPRAGNLAPTEYNNSEISGAALQINQAKSLSIKKNQLAGPDLAGTISPAGDVQNSELASNSLDLSQPKYYKKGDGAVFAVGIEGLCEYNRISNNYVRNVSLDFRQVEGITSFFVANTTIEHNDIDGTPYGAITCGWWWGNASIPPSKVAKNNLIRYNKAGNTHQVLDDGGIIYMLGEQPESRIEGNYVYNGPRCIYPDDGSAYLTITRNVVDNPSYKWMWLHFWTKRCHDNVVYENYVKNNLLMDNGTNNLIKDTYNFRDSNEFSGEALKIIANAGIEEEFKDIIPAEEPEKILIHPADFKEGDVFH
ncbi:right-handed parallel beta-helix repeat-containing protein [Sunxiuqinia indica]|uniref:right-handed parallel beta-helix repeat-containing protein n=1 Tax=Sunxiuqinia indica TaxID=2692584 RepID=UPI001358CDD8|nr:right-handed parallel beta-helix repeat-containing protein [Sunxiuqinia indica]